MFSFGVKLDKMGWIPKLESILIDTYFNPGIENDSKVENTKRSIQIIIKSSKMLKVTFPRIEELNKKLVENIEKCRTVLLIEKSRKIIMDRELIGKVETSKDDMMGLSEISALISTTVKLSENKRVYPISQRCDKLWKLILENKESIRILVTLYISLAPSVDKLILSGRLKF